MKYSVDEIDRMRDALTRRYGFKWPWVGAAEPYSRDVEDKLRTYMIGGVTPEELEASLATEPGPAKGVPLTTDTPPIVSAWRG